MRGFLVGDGSPSARPRMPSGRRRNGRRGHGEGCGKGRTVVIMERVPRASLCARVRLERFRPDPRDAAIGRGPPAPPIARKCRLARRFCDTDEIVGSPRPALVAFPTGCVAPNTGRAVSRSGAGGVPRVLRAPNLAFLDPGAARAAPGRRGFFETVIAPFDGEPIALSALVAR
ncbi:hypothetical protein A33M_0080 [Rhodovulum sp. PH10]|nr:hypothetical protein A33M_0080 [Rhodovulum sp. PH10]